MSELRTAQDHQEPVTGERRRSRVQPWSRSLAWAGIIGPVAFTATFLAQEAFRRGEYSPMAEPVSALEAGPGGWIQQVNFVVFGVLTIAFAVGLQHGIRRTRDVLGPALILISGIGGLLAATFPLREDANGVTYDPGGHIVAGMTFFLASAVGLVALSRRLRRDPRWRSISGYTLAAGTIALAVSLASGTLVVPDDAPLHDWAGLVQRVVVLAVLFPCRIVLAVRLLRVTRDDERSS